MGVHCAIYRGQVESVRVVDAAADVADRDDLRAHLSQDAGRVGANIAVALHRNRRLRQRLVLPPEQLARADRHAAAGRFLAALRAAHVQRLAGDDLEHLRAFDHAGRIGHPRHHLRVRVNVRRGDVALGAEDRQDHRSEAPGHARQLTLRHAGGVDLDAALAAAVGDVHDRAFPGHHGRKALDLVQVDVRVIPDAALARPTRRRMLHAVALEDLD